MILLRCLVATALLKPASCFTAPRRLAEGRAASSSLSLAPGQALDFLPSSWPGSDQALDFLQSSWTAVQNVDSPTDVVPLLPAAGGAVAVAALAPSLLSTTGILLKSVLQILQPKKEGNTDSSITTYPEGKPATYEMGDVVPFEFGPAALVRPLLKQTQLETRKLKLVYDANKDGYDAQVFHQKVDGKGAAVVLCKVAGRWCGGYNPRGWASLGSPRSSVAAFLFAQSGPFGGWQKVRVSRTGSMACGNDFYDGGIQFGADSLVVPLARPRERLVRSRLGMYFEEMPNSGRATLMPRAGRDFQLQELYVLTGVYAPGEDIPNSGGVLELGQF